MAHTPNYQGGIDCEPESLYPVWSTSNDAKRSFKPPKKRVAKACDRCRLKKGRCNASDLGTPCSKCRLEGIRCVISPGRRCNKESHEKRKDSGPAPTQVFEPMQCPDVSSDTLMALLTGKINPFDVSKTIYERPDIIVHPFREEGRKDYTQQRDDYSIDPASLQCPNGEDNIAAYDAMQFFTEWNITTAYLPVTQKGTTQWPQILEAQLPGFIMSFPRIMGRDELCYLKRKNALQIPQCRLRCEIFRSYLEFVHPYMPVIDVHQFLQAIYESGSQSVSLLLFQAVMFAGSAFVDLAYLRSAGYSSRLAARKAFYQRAKLLYEFNTETDGLTLVQSLLLMTYWYEIPTDHKDSWHWLGIAISLAYCLGLHRPPCSEMDPRRKGLQKRVWWSCFMRDRLIALGRSRVFRISDSEVPLLTLEDFDIQSVPTTMFVGPTKFDAVLDPQAQEDLATLCIAKVKLCVCISRVFIPSVLSLEEGDWVKEAEIVELQLMDWANTVPKRYQYELPITASKEEKQPCVILQHAILYMLYHTAVICLHRSRMLLCMQRYNHWGFISHEKARKAAGEISRIGHDLLKLKLERYLPPSSVTSLLYAINIHIVHVSSPCKDTSKQATLGLNRCMNVLERLRETYTSAEYAYQFLKLARKGLSTTNHFEETKQHGSSALHYQHSREFPSQSPSDEEDAGTFLAFTVADKTDANWAHVPQQPANNTSMNNHDWDNSIFTSESASGGSVGHADSTWAASVGFIHQKDNSYKI